MRQFYSSLLFTVLLMIGGHLNRDKLLERINQLGPDMNAARRMSVKVVRSGHTDRLRRTCA